MEALLLDLGVEPAFEAYDEPPYLPGQGAGLPGLGHLGRLHPARLEGTWGSFELDLGELLERARPVAVFEDVITYPAVKQDLAFVVDDSVSAGALVDAARQAAGPELREFEVFDVYRGDQVAPGKKSIAFRAAFQSAERTLSDEDAAELRSRIVAALESGFGAQLRA